MLSTQHPVDMVLCHRHFDPDHRHARLGNVRFSPTDALGSTNGPQSYVFANFQIQERPIAEKSPSSKTVPTFLALYSFGFLYELVLVYDALRMKNTIQIIGLCMCNVGLLVYGAVQVQQIRTAVAVLSDGGASGAAIPWEVWAQSEPFLIIIPCIVALGSVLMAFTAWKLYDEFAWTIYKHISADLRMKRRYLTYQVRSGLIPRF